ncbi:MAG TPA: hypothetical protein VMW00_06935 [Dehalococcoidales bacterium]|nr:hypothetical protein [Dehalococcoidales bacterium]
MRCLLVPGAGRLRPAVLFGGDVVKEVAQVLPGDGLGLGPAAVGGVPREVFQDHVVIGSRFFGQVGAVAKSGD